MEVNGYVHITGNMMKRIPLTNLRVIRGDMTFDPNDAKTTRNALYIGYNQESKINGSRSPLKLAEIDLRNLQCKRKGQGLVRLLVPHSRGNRDN